MLPMTRAKLPKSKATTRGGEIVADNEKTTQQYPMTRLFPRVNHPYKLQLRGVKAEITHFAVALAQGLMVERDRENQVGVQIPVP